MIIQKWAGKTNYNANTISPGKKDGRKWLIYPPVGSKQRLLV
jgi:hypothetical protein